MPQENGNSGATAVVVTMLLLLIIGIAFYFGFVRGDSTPREDSNAVDVELNVPDVDGGGGSGEAEY